MSERVTRGSRRGRWAGVALGLIVVGTLTSVAAAHAVTARDDRDARRAFGTSVAAVAAALRLSTQHQDDLMTDAAAYLSDHPDAGNQDLRRWAAAAGALRRYPELLGLNWAVLVPAAGLPAFSLRILADPPHPLGADGTFQVAPPGARPYYCLAQAGLSRGTDPLAAGLDLCGTGRPGLAVRDSGHDSYATLTTPTGTAIAVDRPVYRGGLVPRTLLGRQQNFLGWLGLTLDPAGLLDQARPAVLGLRLRRGATGAVVETHRGAIVGDAQSATFAVAGWTATVSGPGRATGIVHNGHGLGLLGGGVAVSLLLGGLVYRLGAGRARAVELARRRAEQLNHQARHDGLTGLPNRVVILDRVERALARARRHGGTVAVMFLDLDGFKDINDSLGHPAGDHLLREVADRLSDTLRDCDSVGRLGGDEFVVLVEGDSGDAGAEYVAGRIRAALAEPVQLTVGSEIVTVSVRTSIGIAVGVRASAEELLRDADIAVFEAKNAGKDRYVLFAAEMHIAAQQRVGLESDLRAAIGTDQFFLMYQPILDLQTDRMTGVEALLRWQHPTRGVVMPDAFIPLAEQTGLIVPMGHWVLGEAARQAARWQDLGRPLSMAVNVSRRQLESDVDFVGDVRAVLAQTGLRPDRLTLEVTESMLMRDPEQGAVRLRELKDLGVRLAIDDFGSGYSSLAYLQQFPVDTLKIDRSFIAGMNGSAQSAALVRTVIQLGRMLGIETVGEGIEETSQLDRLRVEHCDRGQGFLFGRPMLVAGIDELMTEDRPARRG